MIAVLFCSLLLVALSSAWTEFPSVNGGFGNEGSADNGNFGASVYYPSTITISVGVYLADVTPDSGNDAITCYIERAPDEGYDWFAVTMEFSGTFYNNDVFSYTYSEPPGSYQFTVACSFDGGNSYTWLGFNSWVYILPIVCDEDFYANSSTTCTSCPVGSTSPPGSTSISACVCNAGLIFNPATSSCQVPAVSCGVNQYTSDGQTCTNCPAGSTSPGGNVGLSSCTCATGYDLDISSLTCLISCPANYFAENNNNCVACPSGATSAGGISSVGVQSCQCPPNLVLNPVSIACNPQIAWVGNLYPSNSGDSPYVASVNTPTTVYMQVYKQGVTDQPGQGGGIQCFLYISSPLSSPSGPWDPTSSIQLTYFNDVGNNDQYSVQLEEPAGLYGYTGYCIDEWYSSSQQYWNQGSNGFILFQCLPTDQYNAAGVSCNPCSANQYLSGSQCVNCPANTTSPTQSFYFTDCVCAFGSRTVYFGSNIYCVPCPAGTYASQGGQCTSCPTGSSSPVGSLSASSCVCSPGYLTSGSSCEACPANTYQEGKKCFQCPPFTTSPAASAGLSSCVLPGSIPPITLGPMPFSGGVQFRVWSPNAQKVYISGTFNKFGKTELTSEYWQQTWFVSIAGAQPGDQYQYIIDNGYQILQRVDPYSRALNTSASLSIVHNPNFEWESSFSIPRPFPPFPPTSLAIYELHVETFNQINGQPGTLTSAIARLGYLQSLGINAIELLPVTEFDPSSPSEDWGYDNIHFVAVEDLYGGYTALKSFVKAAHDLGIIVILDVVFNHMLGSNTLNQFDYVDNTYQNGIYFYPVGDAEETEWGPRPNFDNPQVRKLMTDSLIIWMTEFGVDGFRWDSTICIRRSTEACWDSDEDLVGGIALMNEGNSLIHLLGGVSIAEDLQSDPLITTPTAQGGYGFDLQWDDGYWYDIVERSLVQVSGFVDLSEYAYELTTSNAATRVNYVVDHDHDDPSLPQAINSNNPTGVQAVKLNQLGLGISLLSPGAALFFQGTENASPNSFTFSPPPPAIDWTFLSDTQSALYYYPRDILALRSNSLGTTAGLLPGGSLEVGEVDSTHLVVVFHRYRTLGAFFDDTIVVASFNSASQDFTLQVPAPGAWAVRFNGDSTKYSPLFGNTPQGIYTSFSQGNLQYITVTLPPYTLLVLSIQPSKECPAFTDGNATWPLTKLSSPAYGTCISGFVGVPTRQCYYNSAWGSIIAGCYPATNTCPSNTSGGVNWNATLIGTTASAPCPSGTHGTLTRSCNFDSIWNAVQGTCQHH